jgi:hypothetical protein
MPFIAAVGQKLSIQELLDKWDFEDIDDAEIALEEAGITIFVNGDDVFLVNSNKYKIIDENRYFELDFTLTKEEENVLSTYSGKSDKRIKLFWVGSDEEEIQDSEFLISNLLKSVITEEI